ncbi:hypothetical protein VNO77_14217 [Canavalia gladiata]|uniref:Uncharacterized protein n=1 Tax=Canavalia gladiata TaxID=3824 RepID=A0AAN9QQP4_CANGL
MGYMRDEAENEYLFGVVNLQFHNNIRSQMESYMRICDGVKTRMHIIQRDTLVGETTQRLDINKTLIRTAYENGFDPNPVNL